MSSHPGVQKHKSTLRRSYDVVRLDVTMDNPVLPQRFNCVPQAETELDYLPKLPRGRDVLNEGSFDELFRVPEAVQPAD